MYLLVDYAINFKKFYKLNIHYVWTKMHFTYKKGRVNRTRMNYSCIEINCWKQNVRVISKMTIKIVKLTRRKRIEHGTINGGWRTKTMEQRAEHVYE